jgi:hypothetical protein
MKKFLLCLSIIVLFSSPVLAAPAEYAEREVLVLIFAPAYDDYNDMDAYTKTLTDQAEALAKKYGLEARNTYPAIAKITGKSIILLRSETKSTEELMEELSSDPEIISVEPNFIVSIDPPIIIPNPDPKPDPNPDPKPDPNPDPKPDPNPDPKPAPNPDPNPDPDPNRNHGGGCNSVYGSISLLLANLMLLVIKRK